MCGTVTTRLGRLSQDYVWVLLGDGLGRRKRYLGVSDNKTNFLAKVPR